jgi:hypothetical protein
MAIPQLLRWATRSILRHPAPWLGAGLLVASWPAVASFTELGITTTPRTEQRLVLQLVFAGLLLGVLWGRALAGRASWVLDRSLGAPRLVAEGVLMATPACWFVAAALLAPLATGALEPGALLGTLLRAAISLAHLVALALALGRLADRDGCRWAGSWWALPLLVWPLPAWLAGAGPLAQGIGRLLDPRLALDSAGISPFGDPAGSALQPILAWGLTALLLALPPRSATNSPAPAEPAG